MLIVTIGDDSESLTVAGSYMKKSVSVDASFLLIVAIFNVPWQQNLRRILTWMFLLPPFRAAAAVVTYCGENMSTPVLMHKRLVSLPDGDFCHTAAAAATTNSKEIVMLCERKVDRSLTLCGSTLLLFHAFCQTQCVFFR